MSTKTAAPEMLAIARDLVRLWDAGLRPQIVKGGHREEQDFAACVKAARSAVAEADGRPIAFQGQSDAAPLPDFTQ